MGRRQGILNSLADRMDLPAEAVPGLSVAELWGDGKVLVENHKGVLGYSPEEILVKVSYGQLKITGTEMRLKLMTGDQLIISGKIDSISAIRRGSQ